MTCGRLTTSIGALACAVAIALSVPTGAFASGNIGPSTAAEVKVGVPFTGSWNGTKGAGERGITHWWRLPGPMRPGDEVQLAIDNRSGRDMDLCLVPPVDDFGADDALSACDRSSVSGGIQDRRVFPYGGSPGQPFLVADLECFCEESEVLGTYSITVEQITTLVNIGLVVPSSLPASFTLSASLTYGDNTPAADGVPASLQWRYAPFRGSEPEPFSNVVETTTVGGVATFAGTMPASAQGTIVQMRACATQPGGTSVRCGSSAKTSVAVSACTRASANLVAYGRSVHRLKRRLRQAKRRHAGLAIQRLERRLKAKRRRLRRAKHAVEAHC